MNISVGQNSSVVTENTKIPFGRAHRGKRLRDCPTDYLAWMSANLWDTDFHEYAIVARKIVAARRTEEEITGNLEEAADDFLREHGIDPKKL
jgi:hypothetical protein